MIYYKQDKQWLFMAPKGRIPSISVLSTKKHMVDIIWSSTYQIYSRIFVLVYYAINNDSSLDSIVQEC